MDILAGRMAGDCLGFIRGHFSKPGAEYLSLLVPAFIKEKGW